VRQFAERQAINTPVQGTAADLIKAAMVRVAQKIDQHKLATRAVFKPLKEAIGLDQALVLVSGAAPIAREVIEFFASLDLFVQEIYGQSEDCGPTSFNLSKRSKFGSVGIPLPGVDVRIADDGEILMKGPGVMNGYHDLPEATAEAFGDDGWYRTGDVAVIDSAGMHRIIGRESVDLIKSGGYRIGAGEIETVLLGHPGVAEVAVVGLPDADLGQRIVAFVVGDANSEELIRFVAEQLSVHKRPREVRLVDALPRNAMGKVVKKELMG
jgi:fatty acid CoA ligase FadD36